VYLIENSFNTCCVRYSSLGCIPKRHRYGIRSPLPMPGFRVTICNYRYAQLCQLCFKVSVTGYVQKVEKKQKNMSCVKREE